MVLNLRTGLVFPQHHVVIDDDFLAVPSLRAGTVPSNWKELVDNTREKSADRFYDITKTWFEADTSPAHAPTSQSGFGLPDFIILRDDPNFTCFTQPSAACIHGE